MRRIVYVFGGLAAAGAATYLVVYLYWWQWQRALICGVLLLVVEVMLFGNVVLGRLARIEQRLRDSDRRQRELAARQEDVLARLRSASAEPEEARFRWLEGPADRTYVFVPVLMVTGVLLSVLAWVVQRIASATARPAERRLAGRLAVLAAPDPVDPGDPASPGFLDDLSGPYGTYGPYRPYRPGNLHDPDDPEDPASAHDFHGSEDLDDLDDLDDLPPVPGPRTSPGRVARTSAVAVVGGALLAALVVGLAELTQTREEENGNEATSVLLQVDLRGGDLTPERRSLAAQQVWERCRDSTSVPLRHATLGELGDGVFVGTVRPALTEHDRMRLRGCLQDATLERAHLTVVAIGDADADGE